MDLGTVTAILACLLSVIATLIVVIRWVLDSKPEPKKLSNGNATYQSRDCFEQHQEVISLLKELLTAQKGTQKTLDDRQAIFEKVDNKLDSINLTVHGDYNGPDHRK